jgi:hypothetical protein
MAIKELFQDARPQVLFDPRASQRIDPRFKFTRAGAASYCDSQGVLRYVPANQPRLDHNPATGEELGLLVEEARTNLMGNSNNFSSSTAIFIVNNATLAPDGTFSAHKYIFKSGYTLSQSNLELGSFTTSATTVSFFAKKADAGRYPIIREGSNTGYTGTFNLNTGVATASNPAVTVSMTPIKDDWYRCAYTHPSAGGALSFSMNTNVLGDNVNGFFFFGFQVETGSFPTSYIPTAGSTVTRPADLLSIDTDIPSSGSLYIDAQVLDTRINTTLLSAANAANDKLLLQVQQPANLYGSTGLVYSVDGAFKPTLPFPVPGTTRERNLITWGANNYHYRADSARSTASSAASVPDNMIELGIGHDVTDPTKGFTGYINTVYMWPGEITPTVAEALVRGDIDVKDADVVDPVPADTLAFVFNTQGITTNGNTQITLPLRGSTNNVLVDWGDNTSSAFVGAAADANVTKTYSAAGIYSVQITSDSDGTNEALENLLFFGNNPTELFRVQKWGGAAVFRPTTMYQAFRDCTQLDFENAARTGLPDTSAITDWREAFYNCASISGTFPTFDTSAATTFYITWLGCSSMTAFPFIESSSVTNFQSAWQSCSSLTSFPLINTAAATNFVNAWYLCTSLTSFPLIDTSSGISFYATWRACTSLTSFPLINTAAGISFSQAWFDCTSLTSFPLINTAAATDFSYAWRGCSSLTSFPEINTAAVTNFFQAWFNCTSLTSFPLINTAAGTDLRETWYGCSSLTSFPLINTAAATNLIATWFGCSSLTSFPLINTAVCTNFGGAWFGCTSLTSFPLINTAASTGFSQAWFGCGSLTSFPLIDTSSGIDFFQAWLSCTGLTSFPEINTAAGTNFSRAWYNCNGLTAFPALNFDAAVGLASDTGGTYTGFRETWISCDALADFPANLFDNTTCTRYLDAFTDCALTAQSIENILVSINTAGTSNGNLSLQGGTNANTSTWSTAANNAYIALVGRGWTITQNGTAPS